jgi:pimeloyl-ACP methyl ester carboxylesterase
MNAMRTGRVSAGRSRRVGLALVAIVALVGLGSGSVTAAEADPVLLVHGYRGDPSTWSDMIARFAAQGRTAMAIDLATEDNIANANAIGAFITARGWKRVDIVGQSMGGLSARQFVKFVRSTVTVDSYVSLGTPQYGIYSACVLPGWYGGQMCPSSAFLRDLNRRDDTPGKTAWMTIYSTSDEFVPNDSSRLDGGACHVQVSGVGHNDMDNDAGIFGHVLAGVDGACTGTFR